MSLIAKFLISVLSILAVAAIIPGVSVSGFYIAAIVALLLGIINVTLKPILVFLTLPINIVTLGLFTFVINALLFWFVATFVEGFSVDGFFAAFVGALVVSAFTYVGEELID